MWARWAMCCYRRACIQHCTKGEVKVRGVGRGNMCFCGAGSLLEVLIIEYALRISFDGDIESRIN